MSDIVQVQVLSPERGLPPLPERSPDPEIETYLPVPKEPVPSNVKFPEPLKLSPSEIASTSAPVPIMVEELNSFPNLL